MRIYGMVDLESSALVPSDVDLSASFHALARLYQDLEDCLTRTTAGLDLPCKAGCDACCHQSVFLTPLEFLAAWDWLQEELTYSELHEVVISGLEIYLNNQLTIDQLDTPPAQGSKDHFNIVKELRFRCPILSANGRCRVHPARELYARLFGSSWERTPGSLYACHIVAEQLKDRELSLLVTKDWAKRLNELPLTHRRTVYPAYIAELYGLKRVPIAI